MGVHTYKCRCLGSHRRNDRGRCRPSRCPGFQDSEPSKARSQKTVHTDSSVRVSHRLEDCIGSDSCRLRSPKCTDRTITPCSTHPQQCFGNCTHRLRDTCRGRSRHRQWFPGAKDGAQRRGIDTHRWDQSTPHCRDILPSTSGSLEGYRDCEPHQGRCFGKHCQSTPCRIRTFHRCTSRDPSRTRCSPC